MAHGRRLARADLARPLAPPGARLDARCDIEMVRTDANPPTERHTSHVNFNRVWEVRIRERSGSESTVVTCRFGRLAGALEGTVQMAKQYGWHKPAGHPVVS